MLRRMTAKSIIQIELWICGKASGMYETDFYENKLLNSY